MMSKHPVGEQRASKVKFLEQFLPPPPPSAPPSLSSAPPVLADGCQGDRFEQYVRAARSHQPAGQLQLSRGFFLHSLGKNEAHSSTQERPLKPGRGSARRVCPLSPGGARSSAPRRQAGARGALSSPRFVLPTSTGLMKLENGSRVSLGYSLHLERETQRGQHKKASLPVPSLLPQHLCPPTRAKRLLGAR